MALSIRIFFTRSFSIEKIIKEFHLLWVMDVRMNLLMSISFRRLQTHHLAAWWRSQFWWSPRRLSNMLVRWVGPGNTFVSHNPMYFTGSSLWVGAARAYSVGLTHRDVFLHFEKNEWLKVIVGYGKWQLNLWMIRCECHTRKRGGSHYICCSIGSIFFVPISISLSLSMLNKSKQKVSYFEFLPHILFILMFEIFYFTIYVWIWKKVSW